MMSLSIYLYTIIFIPVAAVVDNDDAPKKNRCDDAKSFVVTQQFTEQHFARCQQKEKEKKWRDSQAKHLPTPLLFGLRK